MGFFFTMLWIEQWLKLMRFLPLKAWQEITTCMVSTTDVTLIVARQKEWSLYKSEPKYKQSCLPVAPFIRQYIFFFKSLTTPITVSCHIFTWLIPYYLGCRVKKKTSDHMHSADSVSLSHELKCAFNHRGQVAHVVNKQVAFIYRPRQPTSGLKLLPSGAGVPQLWRAKHVEKIISSDLKHRTKTRKRLKKTKKIQKMTILNGSKWQRLSWCPMGEKV